jgi:hypothetical protein
LLGCVLGLGCLPNPQSVKEHRENFDRSSLKGTLILDVQPAGMHEIGAVFTDRIKLLGYTTDPPQPKRGDDIKIKLYWTALRPVNEDYQVFVHGDALGGNARRIHADHFPADGKYPMDVWREGEIVVDPFTLPVPRDYGPEHLGVFTGLYLGDYRVPLSSAGNAPSDNENRSRAVELTFPPAAQ